MPEFDAALFPSFEAGVPKLAPLPPLLNEDDARAALTETSPFYFLDDGGLLTRSAPKNATTKVAMSDPAAVRDLKLPRQQFDIGSVRRDFPILQRTGERPSADLAGQRRDHAKAAERDRSHFVLLRARELEHSSCRP